MSNMVNMTNRRLFIRIGSRHLSFATVNPMDTDTPITYEPYVVKSGMSMAANLREAMKGAGLAAMGFYKAQVLLDTPVLIVPVEQFQEKDMVEMFNHSYPGREQDVVLYNVLPDLNAVTVFSINKDLKLVLDDNFSDVRFIVAMSPVWRLLHQRSFTGARNKLYGYFHNQRLDIFSFQQNRFKFCNQFEANHAHDALYFLLYVWKQLLLQPEHDELHLVGDVLEQEWLVGELRKYLQKAYVINPTAEFNRAPATKVKEMPFDLMTLLTKGR